MSSARSLTVFQDPLVQQGFTGKVSKGDSLFAVVRGNEILTAGPYFPHYEDALAWAFESYHFRTAEIVPPVYAGDPIIIPDDPNWVFDGPIDKFLYFDLPPILIEIQLAEEVTYSMTPIKEQSVKFDPEGDSINANESSMSNELLTFYDPKSLSSESYNNGLALYKIYSRNYSEFHKPFEGGLTVDSQFIESYRRNLLFFGNKYSNYFWRIYTALRISSPQNLISKLTKRPINWPALLLKFFQIRTLYSEYNYATINQLLFANPSRYVGPETSDRFGLGQIDAHLLSCIAERISTLGDYMALMSVDKKRRRVWFEQLSFQRLLLRKFCPSMGNYFLTIDVDDSYGTLYRDIANSRHQRNLGRMGLSLDLDDVQRSMSRELPEIEMIGLMKTCNTFTTSYAVALSFCWGSDFSYAISVRTKPGTVNRSASMPFEKLQGNPLFKRRVNGSPSDGIASIRPNGSWAFSFPPYCMQNGENTSRLIDSVKHNNDVTKSFGVKMTMYCYDAHRLIGELSWMVKRLGHAKLFVKITIGPHNILGITDAFYDLSELNGGIGLRGEENRSVGSDPVMLFTMSGETINVAVLNLYPLLVSYVRYMAINKKMVRADITGERL